MDLIFPFKRESNRVVKGREGEITSLWDIKFGNAHCIFQSEYAEKIEWIANYAQYLYDSFLSFRNGKPFEHSLWNTKYNLVFDGEKLKEAWLFDSLKNAIDIMFIDLLKSERPNIKLCKHCGKPFHVKMQKSEYCSASCRNVYNVKMSRQRHKK